MVRAALRYVSTQDSKAVVVDLKKIYEAATVVEAEQALDAFAQAWDAKYPTIAKMWRAKWTDIITLFNYPPAIRKAIYTTQHREREKLFLRENGIACAEFRIVERLLLPYVVAPVAVSLIFSKIFADESTNLRTSIRELAEIESAYITTIHSYTTDQRLHDSPHKDLRRARAAALSIVPTSTGAAKALTRIFPELENHMGGCGMRVPVPDGSLTDLTLIVRNPPSVEAINAAFKKASETTLKGILSYTQDPIVSVDIVGDPHSVIFDSELTSVIGNMVKVVGWYDNEAGYSNRLIDLMHKLR